MSELFHALGINLSSLIIQGLNFAILLVVLIRFVYRPLAKIMEERRKKIELGVKGGEQAARILADPEQTKGEKIREGESQAVEIITTAEIQGQKRSQEIVSGAEKKAQYITEEALAIAQRRKQEEFEQLAKEANALVKAAIIKTVQLDPTQIDEALIQKAIHEIRT